MSSPMHEMPEHMLIPVRADGEGPVPEAEADHWSCWCGCGARNPDDLAAADEIERLRAVMAEAVEELDNCGHCTCGYVAAGRHLLTDALKGTTDDD